MCGHLPNVMTITVEVDLPEEVIREARTLGLLESKRMTAMLAEELSRRRAGRELRRMLDQVRSASGAEMSMEEVNAEVKAARAERRLRCATRTMSRFSPAPWLRLPMRS